MFEGEETHLSVVYGTISDGVQTVLVSCIVLSVILCVCGSIVHGILVSCVCVCVCARVTHFHTASSEKASSTN